MIFTNRQLFLYEFLIKLDLTTVHLILIIIVLFRLVLPLRYVISFFLFIFLLFCCFFGYFVYSFTPCGIVEFTFFCAFVAWFRTFLSFISSEKFSVYIRKGGDSYLKTVSILLVEVVSEFSRPLALTVRLTVNIIVGHLIRMLVYLFLENSVGYFYTWVSVFAIIMECFVFFIQRYIFSRLIYLYLNE